ncbi:MAG: TetR/AcrR family transcriptional regulator, partial [Actinobacteria bacterium]|nr:TetR/AcrR family transcriptional regulator [Actinomycetota bacterium]
TLYYYFTGKEEILAFLLSKVLGELREAVTTGLEASGNAEQRLRKVIEVILEVMASEPDPCRALLAEMARTVRMPELATTLVDGFYGPVQKLLEEGAKDGSLRKVDDSGSTAITIFGAVTTSGIARLMIGHDLAAKKVAAQVVSLILDGVGAKTPALAASGATPRPRRRSGQRAS